VDYARGIHFQVFGLHGLVVVLALQLLDQCPLLYGYEFLESISVPKQMLVYEGGGPFREPRGFDDKRAEPEPNAFRAF